EGRARGGGLNAEQARLGDVDARGGGARRGIRVVSRGVDRNQQIVHIHAAEQKHADERLVIRGRSLHVRARQVEQVEVGDDARAPQRERATKEFAATVIQARIVLHLNAPLETAASSPAGTARSSRGSAYRSQRRRSRRCRCMVRMRSDMVPFMNSVLSLSTREEGFPASACRLA